MNEIIQPAIGLNGAVNLPGDKSISHRYAMLASISEGESKLHNYSGGGDCQSTLRCIEALGAEVRREGSTVTIRGAGLDGLKPSPSALDAGNSGSTIRMLSGILAAQPFDTHIGGDESLSRRPMGRIIAPLTEMGAHIRARDGRYPPLQIHGRPLHPIDYTLPVASAQVKSCILFAGLFCDGVTTVREPMATRDHSELALQEFGAEVSSLKGAISVHGRPRLQGRELAVPGDISSAAFFLVAATLVPNSRVSIHGVGLNPTRSALLDFLAAGGARIRILQMNEGSRELSGDLLVQSAEWQGGVLEKSMTAALIDEIPVLAVLGAASKQGLIVRDAAELRVKETDRIATIAANLRRMGVEVSVRDDGFEIPGRQRFHHAEVDSFGDHRIAMAFSVAALIADGPCTIRDAGAAAVSFPGFFGLLRDLSE